MRKLLEKYDATAFTDTFEDLGDLKQLPGLAVQRLMAEGYGFGAEGDWKTAALVRACNVIGELFGGAAASFMEDYVMDMEDGLVLAAHMLEISPAIAAGRPSLEIHPLGIGGKDDPVRLVFDGKRGPALMATMIETHGRYRMIIGKVNAKEPKEDMPNLPVARVMFEPLAGLATCRKCWMAAGGTHHSSFTYLQAGALQMLAQMTGIECLTIDEDTTLQGFKKELMANSVCYHLKSMG